MNYAGASPRGFRVAAKKVRVIGGTKNAGEALEPQSQSLPGLLLFAHALGVNAPNLRL